MHLPLISVLTELWHLLDVSAVAGHGAVLAALLFRLTRPVNVYHYDVDISVALVIFTLET